ncbi:hypothetical protein PO909_025406 [Leuciscus waleckii]
MYPQREDDHLDLVLRLEYLERGGVPSAMPRSSSSAQQRATSWVEVCGSGTPPGLPMHPLPHPETSRRALTTAYASGSVASPSPSGPADMGLLRSLTGRSVCLSRLDPLPFVLLPDRGNPRHGCTGTQLARASVCVSPREPSCTDTVQSHGVKGAGLVSCALLAQPDLVPRTRAPRDSPSLAHFSEEGPAFLEMGHPMAPPLETPCLVPGRDAEVLGDLPQAVVDTITFARALSMH